MLDNAKKFLHKIQLKNKQRVLNKQFEEEGLSDELLKQQVELNRKRNELDIPDESEFIYENYVQ